MYDNIYVLCSDPRGFGDGDNETYIDMKNAF